MKHAVHIRKTIKEFVKENRSAAIISSHNMLEVEYLCDRVTFIDRGRVIAEGRPEELRETHDAKNLEEVFVKLVEVG